jgi:hypothetical protein
LEELAAALLHEVVEVNVAVHLLHRLVGDVVEELPVGPVVVSPVLDGCVR